MKFDLKGKTILLTGASKGIGYELSKHLAKEKPKLILVGRRFEDKISDKNHKYIEADLTTPAGIATLKKETKGIKIDILINMAGVGIYSPLEDLSLANSLGLNTPIAP